MERYDFDISLHFKHRICFTRNAFAPKNHQLAEILREGGGRRVLVIAEQAVIDAHADLKQEIVSYFQETKLDFQGIIVAEGGEEAKNSLELVQQIWHDIERAKIDRQSYVLAIGGGAFIDAVGFATATAHRGVRLLRFPTTTLSQDDSGVGVKCAINYFEKKNWVGSFDVPYAVINDFSFLDSQDETICREGLAEAVKVALVKDADFFTWIEERTDALAQLDTETLTECVKLSALAHARHIAEGGDPFEMGSSRPLDFGHWSAHKMEQLSDFQLRHGAAVAIGLALDTLYSVRSGLLGEAIFDRVIHVLQALRLPLWHDSLAMLDRSGKRCVFSGLEEFREHLGGELTVLMLQGIGTGIDVHEIDHELMEQCIKELGKLAESNCHIVG